jgi:hypothetical protein
MEQDTDYEFVRDLLIEEFNPPDDDIAEPAVMADAIKRAAEYIAGQPCTCTPAMVEDYDSCPRCRALGRRADRRIDR